MKLIYTILFACICTTSYAQTWISDTVTLQAGYQNEVYYSLAHDEQQTVEIRNWDLAFATNLFEVTVLANPVNGVTVYKTPYSISDFSTFDSSGYSGWQMLYNEFHDWSAGTLMNARDTSISLDYGWGDYNTVTHLVNGTRVFLLKLEQNSSISFKKFYVSQKDISGNWEFRIADVDGGNDVTRDLDVSDYQTKLFAYYSISDDQFLDREPNYLSWDLLFTRYFAPVAPDMFYPVTGVVVNKNTEVAKAEMIDVNAVQEADYTGLYSTDISTIGYDWKFFNGSTYEVEDSLIYFIKTQNNDVYKLRFTAFESVDGKFMFDRTQIFTSVNELESELNVLLYPNPATSVVNVIVNSQTPFDADVVARNAFGQEVMRKNVWFAGFSYATIETTQLPSGMYFVSIEDGTRRSIVKQFVKQ